jgi:hypothetical protein
MNRQMRKLFLIASVFLTGSVAAQPPLNDNCTNAQGITVPGSGNICITSTNINATSDLTTDACDTGTPGNEIWYTFTATGTQNTVTVTPNGSPALTFAVVTISTFGWNLQCMRIQFNLGRNGHNKCINCPWSTNMGFG